MSKNITNEGNIVEITCNGVEETVEETKMDKVKKVAKKFVKPVGAILLAGGAILGAYALGQKSGHSTSADVCEEDCDEDYLEEDTYVVEDDYE